MELTCQNFFSFLTPRPLSLPILSLPASLLPLHCPLLPFLLRPAGRIRTRRWRPTCVPASPFSPSPLPAPNGHGHGAAPTASSLLVAVACLLPPARAPSGSSFHYLQKN